MTPEEIGSHVEKKTFLPVYLFVGTERLLRDEAVSRLRAACVPESLSAFNEDRFVAGETAIETVLSAAKTLPMMSERRFVWVRSVERWETGADAEKMDLLVAYAKAPNPSTVLVLVADALDGRRKLALHAKKEGFWIACESLDPRTLPRWVLSRAKQRGANMDPASAQSLVDRVGGDLSVLDDAIERLCLFTNGGNITQAEIAHCVSRTRTEDVWALVEAMRERNLPRALSLLSEVVDPRDRGLPQLGAVVWSVRQLARYVAATAGGASSEEAAKRAGVFQPFRARELASKAGRFSMKELSRWLLVLGEADLALKGSRRSPLAVLEDMVMRLCIASPERA